MMLKNIHFIKFNYIEVFTSHYLYSIQNAWISYLLSKSKLRFLPFINSVPSQNCMTVFLQWHNIIYIYNMTMLLLPVIYYSIYVSTV